MANARATIVPPGLTGPEAPRKPRQPIGWRAGVAGISPKTAKSARSTPVRHRLRLEDPRSASGRPENGDQHGWLGKVRVSPVRFFLLSSSH
jgi:hypothetical protein